MKANSMSEREFWKYLLSESGRTWPEKGYAICDTPIMKGKGIIFGLNWGDVSKGVQTEYPVLEKERNWPFMRNSKPFFKNYLGIDSISEVNYSNLCFLRTTNIAQLTDDNWKAALPLFKRYVEYIQPSWLLMLGVTGMSILNSHNELTKHKRHEVVGSRGRIFGHAAMLYGRYNLFAVPHPQSKISKEGRSGIWEKVMAEFNSSVK